jgi:hypothetical protein
MEKFELVVHKKYTCWWADHYEIEAETIEDAKRLIVDDEVDSYYMEQIDDTLEWMYPEENDCLSEGQPTMEIFDPNDPKNKLGLIHSLWDNVNVRKNIINDV